MNKRVLFGLTVGFGLMAGVSGAYAADAAAGEKVFNVCKACHTLEAGKNKVGPSLSGLVGRKAGSVEGFAYSPAMKKAGEDGMVWTEENLTKYVADPKGFVAGNKMAFAGVKKEEDLANLIAYFAQAAK